MERPAGVLAPSPIGRGVLPVGRQHAAAVQPPQKLADTGILWLAAIGYEGVVSLLVQVLHGIVARIGVGKTSA